MAGRRGGARLGVRRLASSAAGREEAVATQRSIDGLPFNYYSQGRRFWGSLNWQKRY
jgi:hypothetical protein